MTITATGSSIAYAGNGVTTTFGLDFDYQLSSDLLVTVTVTATGAVTTLVLGTDYIVNPESNSPATNGSVITTVPVASGSTINIERVIPLTQLTEWQSNDAYPANYQRMENALDKLTMALQDVSNNPPDPGGDTSTFVRGDGSLSNMLQGTVGAVTVPADTQTVMQAGQSGIAAIKVISGAGAQGAFRYAVDGATNAWASQWVYDPNIAAIGWQPYGLAIKGTFGDDGNVAFGGNLSVTGTTDSTLYTGAADASLITTGTINVNRLGSNSPASNLFLSGAGTWAIPAAGGGGVNTTTTGSFTIAAVSSSQTVPVTDATGINVGNYLLISDGTHTIIGQVTVIASLNLTVVTLQVVAGSVGNTMASGAAVQLSSVPGTNTIEIQDATYGPTSVGILILDGATGTSGNAKVSLSITNGPTSAPLIQGSFNALIGHSQLGYNTLGAPNLSDYIPVYPALNGSSSSINAVKLQATTPGYVLNSYTSSGTTKLQMSKIDGSSSINTSTITPALLNCTNSLTDTQAFTYDSASGHFKMAAVPLATGTADQFINGAGTSTNVMYGTSTNFVVSLQPALTNGITGLAFTPANGTTSSGTISESIYNSGTGLWAPRSNSVGLTITSPIVVSNATYPVSAIDNAHFATESAFGMNTRTVRSARGQMGWWDKIRVVSGATGTITVNPATGAYVRFESSAGNFTIAVADTSDAPSPASTGYAAEITLEFQPVVTPYVVTWDAAIIWVDGGTAPQPSQTAGQVSIIKLVRAQEAGDLFGAKWFGYRTFVSSSGSFTAADARTAVLNSTYLIDSSTIAMNVVAGTSATPAVIAGSIGNTQLASGIQASKLQGYPTDSTKFLNGAGGWTVPSGGGGGSFNPASSYNFSGTNTFSATNTATAMQVFNRTFSTLNNSTTATKLGALYPDSLYQDGNAIDVTLVDNYATAPGGGGMGIAYLNHTVTARTIGGESIHHGVDLQSTLTSGFNISHTQITHSKRLNGAYADSLWFNSFGPDSNFSVTPDAAGVIHEFNSGAVRIGEVNYGNAWGDFGMVTRGVGSRWVAGIELFPDWLPGSDGDAAAHHYNASWGIAIGGAGADSFGVTPKNWKGLYITTDGIVGKNDHPAIIGGGSTGNTNGGGGYAVELNGSSDSSNPIGKAINVTGYVDVGIDLSAATFTNTGTSLGAAAIVLAVDQSIKLGPIWLRGHGSGSGLQYSTNGTAWSDITLP